MMPMRQHWPASLPQKAMKKQACCCWPCCWTRPTSKACVKTVFPTRLHPAPLGRTAVRVTVPAVAILVAVAAKVPGAAMATAVTAARTPAEKTRRPARADAAVLRAAVTANRAGMPGTLRPGMSKAKRTALNKPTELYASYGRHTGTSFCNHIPGNGDTRRSFRHHAAGSG